MMMTIYLSLLISKVYGLTSVKMELPLTIKGTSSTTVDSIFYTMAKDSSSDEIYMGGSTQI